MSLVDAHAIGERLGVRPGTVRRWHARGLLPAPIMRAPLVWDWGKIVAWARDSGRTGGPGPAGGRRSAWFRQTARACAVCGFPIDAGTLCEVCG